jgi:hypothetical protein
MEGPPMKVVSEELLFLTGDQVVSTSGNAKIQKEILVGKRALQCHTCLT